jgi:type IV pilus assembly protein PilM
MIDFKTLFGRGAAPLAGLDISTSSVRLVELARGARGAIRLERYAAEPLPRGAVVDGNIENMDQVVEVVRRLWKTSGARARLAALGMPPAAVITRKLILPAGLSEDQLEVQVESEAGQYVPYALDEACLDFDVLGPAANAPGDIEVMLAAARREKVEDRVAIAEASGLKATVLDIDSYAARAALARLTAQRIHAGAGRVMALFQIGAQATHISIVRDGVAIYEDEKPFGGNSLTQDIGRAYGMGFDEAEARKKAGDLPDNYAAELLAPFFESAALEVTRAIEFFYASTPYGRVDQLFLAGGCALMPGLLELVAGRTRIASAVISPFKGMQLGASVREAQLRSAAPAYLVACGLALRRFDS